MPNMQVLCPYYVKGNMKAMLYWQMCSFIFQIWAQWIDSKTTEISIILFQTFWRLFRFKSKYGCPISSKITKLYFISKIIVIQRFKDHLKFCTTTELTL